MSRGGATGYSAGLGGRGGFDRPRDGQRDRPAPREYDRPRGGRDADERRERRPDHKSWEFKAYVGDISRDAYDDDTNAFVKRFGNPLEVFNSGKGYSFVKFGSAYDAQSFVDKINGKDLCGQRVRADTCGEGSAPSGGRGGRGGGGRDEGYGERRQVRRDDGGYGGDRRRDDYNSRDRPDYAPPRDGGGRGRPRGGDDFERRESRPRRGGGDFVIGRGRGGASRDADAPRGDRPPRERRERAPRDADAPRGDRPPRVRRERRPAGHKAWEFKAYVGDVSKDADNEAVTAFVNKFGKALEVFSGKGYAFVKFDTDAEAKSFVTKINGQVLSGQPVRADICGEGSTGGGRGNGEPRAERAPRVRKERPEGSGERRERRPDRRWENKAYVGEISKDASEDAVNAFVKRFGNPLEVFNSGKGFAFVKFGTAEEVKSFVTKANGQILAGQAARADVCGEESQRP